MTVSSQAYNLSKTKFTIHGNSKFRSYTLCVENKVKEIYSSLNTAKKGGTNADDNLSSLSDIVNSLGTIRDVVSDEDLVFFALSGLPSYYEKFMMNIESMKLSITFTEHRARLLLHGQSLATYHVATVDATFTVATRGRGDDTYSGSRTSNNWFNRVKTNSQKI